MKFNLLLPFRNKKITTGLLAILLTLTVIPNLFAVPTWETTASPAADLKNLEGAYQLLGNKDLFIQITAQGDKIILKESWTNKEITFTQKSELNFAAAADPNFTLDFARDKTGAVNQVTAFKRDIWLKVKAPATPAKLSPAEAEKLGRTYKNLFTAFEEAINANATDKIQSFLQTYMDESVIAALTLDNLVARAKNLYQETGGIQLDTTKPINPETGTATFKGKSQGNLFQMSFSLSPAGKITNFGMKE